jgi:uracil-DNA glycosylase
MKQNINPQKDGSIPDISGKLYEIAEGIRRCTACPRYKERMLPVPGEFDKKNSKITTFLILPPPSSDDDRLGKFSSFQVPKDCFATPIVKCYSKHQPTKKEIEICTSLWLAKQVGVIKPKNIKNNTSFSLPL